jgi:hypothetical protein
MVAGGDDGLSLRRVGLQWLRRQWLKNRCHASSFSLSANGGFLTKERRALSVMYNSPFILPYVHIHGVFVGGAAPACFLEKF